ncbi:MAG: hypothetical protein COS90_06960 [Deltaproteobacteria bacterium CG07_land_8_20_14_0_80_60_11]|nr:MAG: hypothetical protein COS90_06960 [Deltaproteobacteria bacterium CG07_land_8_20_14_0_80_60_11]
MTRLPSVDCRTMEKVLLGLGFKPVRQKGSHVFYRHPAGRVHRPAIRRRGTRDAEGSRRRSGQRHRL